MDATATGRVGRAVRGLRTERGISLSELARRSGVGKGTLSELEAGRRNPTLETLYAVTTALGVPLGAALDLDAPPAGGHDGIRGSAVTARLLERYEDADAATDVFRITIRAGAVQESAAHIAGTEERLIVLGGVVRVGAADAAESVSAGGAARWAADVPHVYAALGGDADGLLTVRYPRMGARV